MRSGRRRKVRLLLQLAGGLLLIAPSVVPFCLFGPRDAIYAIGSIREEFRPDSWPARCSNYAIYAFILSLPAMGSYVRGRRGHVSTINNMDLRLLGECD
jgi:hypothetical protein